MVYRHLSHQLVDIKEALAIMLEIGLAISDRLKLTQRKKLNMTRLVGNIRQRVYVTNLFLLSVIQHQI